MRAALTLTAIHLIAVESPAEERALRFDFVGTVNHPPSPAKRNLIIHPDRISVGNYVHIYDNVCIEGGRPAKIGSSTAEAEPAGSGR